MIVETAIGNNFARFHVSKTILICHGFPYEGGSVIEKSYSDLANFFSNISPTLIFDFSGCGNSRGYFSFKNCVRDLKRIANKFKNVSIIGYSMGALVAMKAVAEIENVERLALISPPLPEIFSEDRLKMMYYHALSIIRIKRFEDFRSEMIELERGDLLDYLCKSSIPKLVVHGTKDEVVPFECGEKIYRAISEPKYFMKIINGDHFLRKNQKVMQKVRDWFEDKLRDKEIEINV
ncbi:MAG: alpha/beta hydrolase [Archaeoglobaceae archaeon]|nr:alpha/beta hydrolase [Archaeoglobaceae archaeon]MDW7989104.1 alpha/beta hydrolase [Archaeoglobaceae archaeon]